MPDAFTFLSDLIALDSSVMLVTGSFLRVLNFGGLLVGKTSFRRVIFTFSVSLILIFLTPALVCLVVDWI